MSSPACRIVIPVSCARSIPARRNQRQVDRKAPVGNHRGPKLGPRRYCDLFPRHESLLQSLSFSVAAEFHRRSTCTSGRRVGFVLERRRRSCPDREPRPSAPRAPCTRAGNGREAHPWRWPRPCCAGIARWRSAACFARCRAARGRNRRRIFRSARNDPRMFAPLTMAATGSLAGDRQCSG